MQDPSVEKRFREVPVRPLITDLYSSPNEGYWSFRASGGGTSRADWRVIFLFTLTSIDADQYRKNKNFIETIK